MEPGNSHGDNNFLTYVLVVVIALLMVVGMAWMLRGQISAGADTVTASTTTSTSRTVVSITLNPENIYSGEKSVGTVTLNGPAPAGGAVVTLAGNNYAASSPKTVIVPAGASSADFTITANKVGNSLITGKPSTRFVQHYAGFMTMRIWPHALLIINPPCPEYNVSTGCPK